MVQAERGVAYRLWERVNQELDRQRMTQKTLVEKSGVPATTLNRLRTTSRAPAARIVYAIAEALGIDDQEALHLAGRPGAHAPDGVAQVDPLEAIRQSERFTDEQKRTLLEMASAFQRLNASEQGNPSRRAG